MMRRTIHTLSLTVLAFAMMTAGPSFGEECRKISAPGVKYKMEKYDAVVVHVLSKIEFDMQHIAGSVNIPISELESAEKLPANKDTPLIFYCMGEI